MFTNLSKDELEKKLHIFILDLLENNIEKLRLLIYRHDVSEEKFYNALKLPEKEQQAWKITHLVIDRELKKIETRLAYKQSKESNQKLKNQ